MKKTSFTRLIALFALAAMLLSVCACSATNDNPVIAKTGQIKLDFDLYKNFYTSSQNYYLYAQYNLYTAEEYRDMILDQVIAFGVCLDQCRIQGITLNEEEEAELAKEVQKSIDDQLATYASRVDASITDEEAIREAEMELLLAQIESNGFTYDDYVAEIEESLRSNMLLDKLRDSVYAEVSIEDGDVRKYFDENIEDDRESFTDKENGISSFYTAWTNFVSGSGHIPFYNPKDVFTVNHLLVEYDENTDSDDPNVDPSFSKAKQVDIDMIEKELNDGIDLERLLELIEQFGDDPGMEDEEGYLKYGYMIHEDLVDRYEEGFGYAAMKLYDENWEPADDDDDADDTADDTADDADDADDTADDADDADDTTDDTTDDTDDDGDDDADDTDTDDDDDEAAPPELVFFELNDGKKVVRVETELGYHYIYINRTLDSGDLEFEDKDEVWESIYDFVLDEAKSEEYEERYKVWESETKITIKRSLINSLASYLG